VPQNVSRTDIVRDLKALGVKPGVMLGVHSSLNSIGHVDGGAQTVVDALMDAVGPNGTVVMPVFTKPADVFLAAYTPSTTGAVTEAFRLSDGTMRSLHPTHSVAAHGRYAHHVVREHQKRQALGVGSPFHRLAKYDGMILLIGVGFERASIVHVAESLAGAPYQDVFYPGYQRKTLLVAANGKRIKYIPEDNPGDSSAFGVVESRLRSSGRLVEGSIGAAKTFLAFGADIINAALEVLSEDGAGLLCSSRKCAVCPRRRSKVRNLNWRYTQR